MKFLPHFGAGDMGEVYKARDTKLTTATGNRYTPAPQARTYLVPPPVPARILTSLLALIARRARRRLRSYCPDRRATDTIWLRRAHCSWQDQRVRADRR